MLKNELGEDWQRKHMTFWKIMTKIAVATSPLSRQWQARAWKGILKGIMAKIVLANTNTVLESGLVASTILAMILQNASCFCCQSSPVFIFSILVLVNFNSLRCVSKTLSSSRTRSHSCTHTWIIWFRMQPKWNLLLIFAFIVFLM